MAERFLISRLSSLGDVVCTLPVAAALKHGFPESHVTWAVDPRFAGIVECCTAVDEVVRAQPKTNGQGIPTLEPEFDAALDMQGLLKSALVVHKAKAKAKVGYHWQREGSQFFSAKVMPDPSSIHIVDQYVDVARAVGGQADFAKFSLKAKEEDVASVAAKLDERGYRGEPFVVVNPGAGWATKRWPVGHIAALIRLLAAEGIVPVLIGSKSEEEKKIAKEIREALQGDSARYIELGGDTSIRELVALLSMSKAHVGGDTGSTHLSAGLGTPAIGLYSITKPARSCPYGQIERCLYEPKGLHHIDPDRVFNTVMRALA